MAEAVPLALAISAIAGAGSTIYQADAASNAQDKANKAASDQQTAVDKTLKDQQAADKELQTQQANLVNRDAQRRRQLALRRGSQGRSGTILTSGTLAQGDSLGGQTTLLGA